MRRNYLGNWCLYSAFVVLHCRERKGSRTARFPRRRFHGVPQRDLFTSSFWPLLSENSQIYAPEFAGQYKSYFLLF